MPLTGHQQIEQFHAVLKAMLTALPTVTAMATLARRLTMPTRLVATGSPASGSEQDKDNHRDTRHPHAEILLVAAWRARAQAACYWRPVFLTMRCKNSVHLPGQAPKPPDSANSPTFSPVFGSTMTK